MLEPPQKRKIKRTIGEQELIPRQSQKDLPSQLLLSDGPLSASLIIASFGSSQGSVTPVFDFNVERDPATTIEVPEKLLRYGKLAEIHHIFRSDPKNPPVIISIAFALAVLATVPALFIGVRWKTLPLDVNNKRKEEYICANLR